MSGLCGRSTEALLPDVRLKTSLMSRSETLQASVRVVAPLQFMSRMTKNCCTFASLRRYQVTAQSFRCLARPLLSIAGMVAFTLMKMIVALGECLSLAFPSGRECDHAAAGVPVPAAVV